MKKLSAILPIAVLLALVLSPTLTVGAEHADGYEEPEEISYGAYLASVSGCMGCHTPDEEGGGFLELDEDLLFAGGRPFDLGPLGVVTTRNLTPDTEFGIGDWTDEEIKTAITLGVTRDGDQLFPVMPYLHFNTMNEADIDAIIEFLRTLEPISNEVEHAHIPVPPLPPLEYNGGVEAPDPSDTAARGAYLIESVIACTDCHTPVDPETGAPDFSSYLGGGQPFEGPWGIVYGGNITSDSETGIGDWTDEEIKRVLTQGIRPDGRRVVLMPWQEYTHLSDEDLDAVIHFLRNDLPAVQREVPAADLNDEFIQLVELPAEEVNVANVDANSFVTIAVIVVAAMVIVGGIIAVSASRRSSENS